MSFYWVCSGWRCVSFGRLLRLWQTRPNLLGIKLSNITSSGNIWAWVTSRRLFFSSIGGCLMVRTPPGKVPKCVCLCVYIQVNSQWTQHSPDTRFSVFFFLLQVFLFIFVHWMMYKYIDSRRYMIRNYTDINNINNNTPHPHPCNSYTVLVYDHLHCKNYTNWMK